MSSDGSPPFRFRTQTEPEEPGYTIVRALKGPKKQTGPKSRVILSHVVAHRIILLDVYVRARWYWNDNVTLLLLLLLLLIIIITIIQIMIMILITIIIIAVIIKW